MQSFNDKYLKLLGRIHTSREAEKAISICKRAGFKNFNIDLMFGLPSQNTSDALLDLSTAFDQLPTEAKILIKGIEDSIGVPVSLISTGPDRNDMIVIDQIFS